MTKKEQEQALIQLIENAPTHRKNEVLDNFEFKLARKDDIFAAFQIAYGIIHGSGHTKREAKRNAKRKKFEDNSIEKFS